MKKTKRAIPPITTNTTLQNAKRWLNIIRYGESGTIIQLQDDCEFRILEIINNKRILKTILGPFYKKYLLDYVSIDQKDLLKTIKESLIELCNKNGIAKEKKLTRRTISEILSEIANKGYEVGLFIIHLSPLIKKQNFQSLFDLEILIRTSKNFSVVAFSELDITYKKYHILVDKAAFLYDHIIKYPLYDEEDSRQFISHFSSQWKIKLTQKVIIEIIKSCGGHLWLIHQAIRNLRDNPGMNPQEAASDELMVRKLEALWAKFTEEEQSILRKVYFHTLDVLDTSSQEYEYLKVIQAIKEKDGVDELGLPIFSLVIEKENRIRELQVRDNHIFIGEKDLTTMLARKERMFLAFLLAKKKKIVAREAVAQTIWGKEWEEKYSDWALDRLAHRVRKKLTKLGIDEKLLKTVKKKGFMFG